MNLSDLRALVSYWVDDLNAGYFTATQVNAFINNAHLEVQKMLLTSHEGWYQKIVETPLVPNQTDYILPADFLKLHRLELSITGTAPNDETRKLQQITMNQKDLFPVSSGTPQGFYIKRDRVVICPPPDTAYTMRLTYSYRVSTLINDSDVPDVPTQYQEYVAVVAAYDCYVKDDRVPNVIIEKKKFYEDMMRKDMEDRSLSEPRSVVVTEESAFEVF